jgi:hypothetical protein
LGRRSGTSGSGFCGARSATCGSPYAIELVRARMRRVAAHVASHNVDARRSQVVRDSSGAKLWQNKCAPLSKLTPLMTGWAIASYDNARVLQCTRVEACCGPKLVLISEEGAPLRGQGLWGAALEPSDVDLVRSRPVSNARSPGSDVEGRWSQAAPDSTDPSCVLPGGFAPRGQSERTRTPSF